MHSYKIKEKSFEAEIQDKNRQIKELHQQKDKDLDKLEKYGESLKQDFDH